MRTTTFADCNIKTTIDYRMGMSLKCSLKTKPSKRVIQDWFSKYLIVNLDLPLNTCQLCKFLIVTTKR